MTKESTRVEVVTISVEQLEALLDSKVKLILDALSTEKNKSSSDKWFDLKSLIEYLPSKPKPQTVYEWVHKAIIPFHKSPDTKMLSFLKSEIDEWLKSGRRKTLGVVFDPAKSGKTIFTENLLLSLAAGIETFLGDKIYSPTKRVLIVSLEEFYRNRTARNKKQIESFTERFQLDAAWSEEVLQYFIEKTCNDESVIVLTGDLYQHFIESQTLTKPTLHAALNRMVNTGAIEKVAKGEYRIRVAS